MTDTKFKPGISGNPNGRPKGSKDKRTQHRKMFESRAPELIDVVVSRALEGDSICLKMCIERLVPPYRSIDAPISIDMPDKSLTKKCRQIVSQMCEGKLSISETEKILSILEAQIEFEDIKERKKWSALLS